VDGSFWTSPVRTYPPNGFGLYDMMGNVWEWTQDQFGSAAEVEAPELRPGKVGSEGSASYRVIKGGSYLCANNYCDHCRPAARLAQAVDMAACHVGFRCVDRTAA
jgi:formylglycine-generating enzyme required for sulfatase activity